MVPEGAIACNIERNILPQGDLHCNKFSDIERNILPQGDLHCNKFSDVVVQPGRDDQVSKFKWTASDMIRTPISDVSRRSYGRQNEILLCYLFATIPTRQLLTDKALVSLSAADQSIVADKYETVDKYEEIRQSAIRKAARTILQDYENRPIHFEKLSDIIFLDYLIFVTNANKGPLSNAGYSNKRSALFDLFRIYGAEQTIKLQENLKSAMKSLRRKAAIERQKGTGRAGSGMDPMSFNLYRSICLWFLQKGTSDGIFGYCFLVVTWNLCCRAASTVTIQLKLISWREDALCIYFVHTKNDQTGEHQKDPRHVYANPLDPVISPILSIGLYLACFRVILHDGGPLFPGCDQKGRFAKLLA
ncbi:MAG: hypothetical protein ACREBR_00270, partial [bacterium]